MLLLLNCSTKKDKEIYTKPAPEKLDSICQQLKSSDSYSDTSYNRIYLQAYHNLISQKKYDSAARILCYKGLDLEQTYAPDSEYIKLATDFEKNFKSNVSNRFLSSLYLRLGMQFNYSRKKDSSYQFIKKAYLPITDYYSAQNTSWADLFMAHYFMNKGSLDTALKYGLNALDGSRKVDDPKQQLTTYITLYNIYAHLEDFSEAKIILDSAENLAAREKDSLSIFNIYYKKLHYHFVNPKQAGEFNFLLADETEKMFSFYKKWNPNVTKHLIVHLRMNTVYASLLIDKNKLPEAKLYLDTVKMYLNQLNPPSPGYVEDYEYTLDLYHMKAGDVDVQLEKYDAIIKDFEAQQQYYVVKEFYDLFYMNALHKNDFKQALHYKQKSVEASDSLTNIILKSKVKEYDKKYQTAKKEKTIAEQNSKLQTSKFQITSLLFAIAGIILFALIFFGIRKRKEAQAEIIRQQKFTDELLQNTEDERKRIATDLHDGVNHELLTLKNQVNNGKKIESNEIEKVINEVRQVSRDLYPAMFDNIGLVASIEALCERMTEAGLFTTCDINYTLKLSKRNELQLYRIIQEALNNTLKHAKADAAKVTIDTVGSELQVEIKDNGIGFDTHDKMNNASSFGIQSLMQRARAIGGKSTIESNEQGTKLILKTPIH